jgi:preprotein translocase subunit YajC
MLYTLLDAATTGTTSGTAGGTITYWVVMILIVVVFWFLLIRPQRKQQKEQESMLNALKPGDSIMTTGGFYGVVLDIVDDTVIVEFGNNKNCRIPMNKAAIAQVDKPEGAVEEESKEEKKEDKKEKKEKLSLGKKKED